MKEKTKRSAVLSAVLLGLSGALLTLYLLIRGGTVRNVCIFNNLTGLHCPGCGNTRAVMAYLRGDFRAALRHNYLFPIEALYIVRVVVNTSLFYLRNGKAVYKPKRVWIDFTFLALVLIWWVVRNILHI